MEDLYLAARVQHLVRVAQTQLSISHANSSLKLSPLLAHHTCARSSLTLYQSLKISHNFLKQQNVHPSFSLKYKDLDM